MLLAVYALLGFGLFLVATDVHLGRWGYLFFAGVLFILAFAKGYTYATRKNDQSRDASAEQRATTLEPIEQLVLKKLASGAASIYQLGVQLNMLPSEISPALAELEKSGFVAVRSVNLGESEHVERIYRVSEDGKKKIIHAAA